MKKKLSKMLAVIFTFALLFTGCATVGNISNDTEGIIYNGGSAVQVGSYLYFANAYTAYDEDDTSTYDYSANSKISYLARINLDEFSAEDKYTSPDNVEKVSEVVAGYQAQDMFVQGDYLYFTTMNTHKSSSLVNDYSLVSFYRVKLNGDGLKELYTTESYETSTGCYVPMEGSDGGYYWVIFDGSTLYSISLSSGKIKTLAEDVVSVALGDAEGSYSIKEVFYTITPDTNAQSRSSVCSVDYATGDVTTYGGVQTAETITILDRVDDELFYTTSTDTYSTYVVDLTKATQTNFFNSKTQFYYGTISDVQKISVGDTYEGYIFISSSSSSVMYYRKTTGIEGATALLTSDTYTDLLFVEEDRLYFSTENGIFRISVKPVSGTGKIAIETVVEMTSMISGQYAFDGQYIYYFASLEIDEDDESDVEDENIYMYRVKKSGGDYQLVGQTVS